METLGMCLILLVEAHKNNRTKEISANLQSRVALSRIARKKNDNWAGFHNFEYLKLENRCCQCHSH